jgi:hypothetical protein
LFAVYRIRKDLGFFISNRILTIDQGMSLKERINNLCKKLSVLSLDVVEAWDLPVNQLGVIAHNWHDFNLFDNRGEIMYHHPLQDD